MNIFLNNKNFRYLWLSSTFAGAASNIIQYALSLYVLDKTQSSAAFASVLAIVIFPRLLLSPFAGVWGDRANRKRALVWTSLVNVCFLVGMGMLGIWMGGLSLVEIYVLVIVMEMIEVWQSGPMQSVLPSIVKEEELAVANTWMHVDDGIVAVVTPFIAAIVYTQFSMGGALVIGGLVLSVTTLGYMLMTIPPRKDVLHDWQSNNLLKNFWIEFMEGIRVIDKIPHLIQLGSAALLVNFLLSPTFGVVMTTYLRVELQANNAEFSFFESVSAVIGILAPMVALRFMSEVKNPLKLLLSNILGMVGGLGVVLGAVLFYSLNQHQRLLVMGLMVFGFLIVQIVVTYVNIGISTLFAKTVPEKYMGRIGSTMSVLSTISVPMGEFLFGHLMEWSNAGVCLMISIVGLVTFVVFSGKMETKSAAAVEV